MDVSVKAGQNPPIYGQRQDGNLGRLPIDAEVEAFITMHADRTDAHSRRFVVNNGGLPHREILTGAGAISVMQVEAIHSVHSTAMQQRLLVCSRSVKRCYFFLPWSVSFASG